MILVSKKFEKIFLVIVFFLFPLILYVLPSWGIPLHSDISWIYYFQTIKDKNFEKAIPEGMKLINASPKSTIEACVDWYRFAERFSCGDIIGNRTIASLAGTNANYWRVANTLVMSANVLLFFWVSKIIKIPNPINFLITFSLFFAPFGVWLDYKNAEPRAMMWMLISFLLLLKSKKIWVLSLSAFFMFLAVFSKENFVFAWIVIPALIFWKEKPKPVGINKIFTTIFRRFWPHLAAMAAYFLYIVWLKTSFERIGPGSANMINGLPEISFGEYIFANLTEILPVFIKDNRLNLFLIALFLTAIFWEKMNVNEKRRVMGSYKDRGILIFGFFLGTIFSMLPFYLTGRQMLDRYIMPTSYLMAFLLAVLAAPIFSSGKKISEIWLKIIVSGLILIFFLPQIDNVISLTHQNWLNERVWQNLIDSTSKFAPQNSHVVLKFHEPQMVELAFGLEGRTFLAGRRDLTYHLLIEDESFYSLDNGFSRKQVGLFNLKRKPVTEADRVVYVDAKRVDTQVGKPPNLFKRKNLEDFFESPGNIFEKRYLSGKQPFLEYNFSQKR